MTPRQLGIKTAMSPETSDYIAGGAGGAAGGLGGATGMMAGLGARNSFGAMGDKAERKLPQFMNVMNRIVPQMIEGSPNAVSRGARVAGIGGKLGLMSRVGKYKNLLGLLAGLGAGGAATTGTYMGSKAITGPGTPPQMPRR